MLGEFRRLSRGPRRFLHFGIRPGFARIGRDFASVGTSSALRILGMVWKDGACVICSAEELQNCPEEKCTADLHTGALELSY